MKNIDIRQVTHLYYHEKKSVSEIAEIFGCSDITIYNRMQKNGMERRSYSEAHRIRYAQKNGVINLSEIVYLYFEKKLTLKAIGARFGVSFGTIRKRLIENGYRCRKPEGSLPKFTSDELVEMARLYHDEELTPSEIAYQYNSITATIRSSLRRVPGFRFRTRKEARALRKKKEAVQETVAVGGGSDSRLLPPKQVTPERILKLRNEEHLTIDAIAGKCSLSNLQVYNILQEMGGI